MDTLKDIWASLIAGVRDRTTNPLSVAFVLSWCLWNYKFFIVIAGGDSTTEKLHFLEVMYPHARETYLGAALLYPLLSAVAYVFLYPPFGMAAVWVYRKYQVITANLVKDAEGTRAFSAEELRELVMTHEAEVDKLTKDRDGLKTQLKALRVTLAETQRQLEAEDKIPPSVGVSSTQDSTEEQEVANPQDKLDWDTGLLIGVEGLMSQDESLASVVLELTKYTTPTSIDVLATNLHLNPTFLKDILRRLTFAGGVTKDKHGLWQLTQDGERAALKALMHKS